MKLLACLLSLFLLIACDYQGDQSAGQPRLAESAGSESELDNGASQSGMEEEMTTQTIQQLVKQAKSVIKEVTVAEVEQQLRTDKPIVIDVREPHEYASGHIAGAINVPRGVLEFKADPENPDGIAALHDKTAAIVIYCKSGARGALAAQTLGVLGYRSVASLAGGVKAWEEAQLPLMAE